MVNLCKFGGNQDIGSLDFSFLVKFHISKSSFDLENEVKVTKTNQLLSLAKRYIQTNLVELHQLVQEILWIQEFVI